MNLRHEVELNEIKKLHVLQKEEILKTINERKKAKKTQNNSNNQQDYTKKESHKSYSKVFLENQDFNNHKYRNLGKAKFSEVEVDLSYNSSESEIEKEKVLAPRKDTSFTKNFDDKKLIEHKVFTKEDIVSANRTITNSSNDLVQKS